MKWTTEKPTEVGTYLIRDKDKGSKAEYYEVGKIYIDEDDGEKYYYDVSVVTRYKLEHISETAFEWLPIPD